MKRIIEVRAAEGGDDAKLFAVDLVTAYRRMFERLSWKHRLLGQFAIEVEAEVAHLLANEAGGHRIQRIPPTERRGRVHTSTVTVAVVDPLAIRRRVRPECEFRIEWFSGTGKGGQHRNKHQNCCRLIHIATGMVQTAAGRERMSNLRHATDELNRRLDQEELALAFAVQAASRKAQVGSGQRGDKRRTYRFQEDRVRDDITGKSARISEVLAGQFDLLW